MSVNALSCKNIDDQGLEWYCWDLGFGHNTARDSVKSKMSWRNTGFDNYSWSGIRQNLSTGCGIGKGNGIRDGDDRSSGSGGIVVKKLRESGIMTPIPYPAILTERFHSRGQHLFKFVGTKEGVCIRKEFNSHSLVWDTNMAAVSFFWDTNMAAVTSCENTL